MDNLSLIQLTQEQQAIEAALIENYGELTPELEEQFNENAALIATKLDSYHALMRKFDMAETAVEKEIDRLTALKKTFSRAQENLKGHIAYAMDVAGLEKLDGTFCKVSFRKSKSLELDEDQALAEYEEDINALADKLPSWACVQVKVNKTEVKNALTMGEIIPGATIIEKKNIQIR